MQMIRKFEILWKRNDLADGVLVAWRTTGGIARRHQISVEGRSCVDLIV